ncbi:MAG: hypothetical protein ACE5FZ_06875 [Nitrospiria bacterium]
MPVTIAVLETLDLSEGSPRSGKERKPLLFSQAKPRTGRTVIPDVASISLDKDGAEGGI